MTSKAFTRRASTTASTKRPPAVSSNKRGAPTTSIASLACFPLMPVQPDLVERMGLDSQVRHWETYAQGGLDILAGDYLVIGTAEYPIRSVAAWPWPAGGGARLHIVVEDVVTE